MGFVHVANNGVQRAQPNGLRRLRLIYSKNMGSRAWFFPLKSCCLRFARSRAIIQNIMAILRQSHAYIELANIQLHVLKGMNLIIFFASMRLEHRSKTILHTIHKAGLSCKDFIQDGFVWHRST